MKGVCIVSPDLCGVGGVQSYARSVADWIRRAHPERPVHLIDPRGARVAWTGLRLPLALIRLTWLAALGRVDVAHIQVTERMSFLRKGVLAGAARAFGLRVVLHHHGAELTPYYRRRTGAGRWLLRRVFGMADRNIVLGSEWARLLTDEAGVAADRVSVLENGIRDAPTAPGRGRGGALHILFLAAMTPRKGPEVLLEALDILHRRGAAFTATLAGDGARLAHLREETRRRGLEGRVRLPGRVRESEAAALMGRADVYVSASFHEGLPIAILEALRAGTPVISTPVGAIPAAAPEGRGVTFTPTGDVEALADRLADLAADPVRRNQMAGEARRLYEERFTLERHMRQLLRHYGWPAVEEGPDVAKAA